MNQDSISWGELAELTHATQVERFNFCSCEEQEEFPYSDCPRPNCAECDGDGCTKCTDFCGDCLTPLENCGCRP